MAERNMDFPSNSQNPLTGPGPKKSTKNVEEKNIQKLVTGEVVMRPPSLGKRMKVLFFGGEVKGASRYVVTDVILPAVRNTVVDAVTRGIERIVLGEGAVRRPRAGGYDYRPRTIYNQPTTRGPAMLPQQPPRYSQSNRNTQALGDIILQSRDEAESVIDMLGDLIERYEVASVADLHEILGIPSTAIDNKWGWTSPRGAGVSQSREGYILVLPPLEEI